jgi:HAD superfamily hydrolase (TIGR01509 family)
MIDLTRFRAVIFDFDGVIVDSETMQARAWSRVAQDLGLRDRVITAREIAGRIDAELAAELFPGFDAQRCVVEKARVEAELEARGDLRLVDGVERFVRRLALTHALAICSNCHVEPLARRLAQTGVGPAFQAVVGRTDGVPHKPAPDLYLRALAALRVPARDACAIEDSPTGVAAAKAAGVHVIQLVHPDSSRSPDADEWIEVFD